MPKKTNLAEAFRVDENELQPKPEIVAVESTVSPTPTESVSKPKKKHIGGYFPLDVYKQMKILGAEHGMTTQDILTEGLNAVFRLYDKPPIA